MSFNMGGLMKQAQKMQSELLKIQEQLAQETITAASGGGMVKVVANGQQEILQIKIDPSAVESGDIEMLEDMVLAAVREALQKSQSLAQEKMSKLTGGLKIPGLF